MVHTGFTHDLVIATARFLMSSDMDIQVILHRNTILARSREEITRRALKNPDVTHLLWIDTDMRFPPDLFERLIAHNKQFVAANCSKRTRPALPTAFKKAGNTIKRRVPEDSDTGLEQVDGVGAAIMLHKREVYEKIPQPWWETPWQQVGPDKWEMLGEDVLFCAKCANADIPIYIDHDLSWEIGHIGEHEYTMQDVLKDRDELRQTLQSLNVVNF